jgi:hypothetical protein
MAHVFVPVVETHLSPLENAYFQRRVIPEEQFQAILGLLQIFAGHLSQYASGRLLEQADDERNVFTNKKLPNQKTRNDRQYRTSLVR